MPLLLWRFKVPLLLWASSVTVAMATTSSFLKRLRVLVAQLLLLLESVLIQHHRTTGGCIIRYVSARCARQRMHAGTSLLAGSTSHGRSLACDDCKHAQLPFHL